jgi:hypothetical protein
MVKHSKQSIFIMSIHFNTALAVKIIYIKVNYYNIYISNIQPGKLLSVSETIIRIYQKSGHVYKSKYLIFAFKP